MHPVAQTSFSDLKLFFTFALCCSMLLKFWAKAEAGF
jgi:hypothetical protein